MMEKILKTKYLFYFFLYAVFGWCYEVFLEVVVYRWGFSNRGVLFGPYCPVYGVGALAFIFTIYRIIDGKPIKKRLLMIPVVFLGCMAIATLIELITSYLCELFLGSWPWQTYADYKINFQARIALSPSLRFGLGGTIFLYLLQPLFERAARATGEKIKYINIAIAVILIVDMVYSFILK